MRIAQSAAISCKAVVGPASGKGRGVFASTDIGAGELIESAPCIALSEADCDRVAHTIINDYYFHHPGDVDGGLLVLGLASLCNHADEANTVTQHEHDPHLGWLVLLRATRAIRAGEEITRHYACAPWFSKG